MDEDDRQVPYASPQPPPERPPMYSLVLGVLAAAFLMLFGGALSLGVVLMIVGWINGRRPPILFLFLFVPLAAMFVSVGALSMRQTIAFLRGMPPQGKRWERWAMWFDPPYFHRSRARSRGDRGDAP